MPVGISEINAERMKERIEKDIAKFNRYIKKLGKKEQYELREKN